MARTWQTVRRSVVSFYDDQGTHHAAALTYYALMSLFPTLLLAVSLLGLLGEYPGTYDSILGHLRGVVPAATLSPIDAALRAALRSKGTATVALILAVLTALYGATGYLEAARRSLNVVFEASSGRSFLRRKLVDVASTFLLLAFVLITLVLVFAGGSIAQEVLGPTAASAWRIVRWPGAFASALVVFSYIYYVTPDVRQRGLRWIVPGAVVGVAIWLGASAAFSAYLANFRSFNVTYGSFAAAIILLVWLWLTNVALLFGAEVNAEIERAKRQAGRSTPDPRMGVTVTAESEVSSMNDQPNADWNVAEWHGKLLVDSHGEKIGKLQDVYVDVETDEPQFATVKEGLINRHLTFVPLGSIAIGPDELRVAVTKEQVASAPNIEQHGEELSQADESALYHHYELNYTAPNTESGRRLARR